MLWIRKKQKRRSRWKRPRLCTNHLCRSTSDKRKTHFLLRKILRTNLLFGLSRSWWLSLSKPPHKRKNENWKMKVCGMLVGMVLSLERVGSSGLAVAVIELVETTALYSFCKNLWIFLETPDIIRKEAQPKLRLVFVHRALMSLRTPPLSVPD